MKNFDLVCDVLNFSRSEVINYGPFFWQSSRSAGGAPGAQIDFLIHRNGNILTLVERQFIFAMTLTLGKNFNVGLFKGVLKAYRFIFLILVAQVLTFSSCKKQQVVSPPLVVKDSAMPQRVKVQHILIGFDGSLPGKEIKRTQVEAEKLAADVLIKAQGGDFEALVKEYSDDRAPGIYSLSDKGVAPQGEEFPREQMVPGFGDLSFSLKINEVGLVPFEKTKSPFGFHIIKRLE